MRFNFFYTVSEPCIFIKQADALPLRLAYARPHVGQVFAKWQNHESCIAYIRQPTK